MGEVNQISTLAKEDLLAFWRAHAQQWKLSGLSRAAYCQREGLSLSSFDYRRAQIRVEQTAAEIVQADTPATLPNKTNKTNKTRSLPDVKSLQFIPAVRVDEADVKLAHALTSDVSERIYLHSPSGWQIHLTLQHITHDLGAVTTLLDLVQVCR